MTYTLENGSFKVRVSNHGAELQGLYSKKTDREYLWQAAPETWGNHSLLLFPACGRVAYSRMICRGREYPLPMHGFAKDMDFTVTELKKDSISMEIHATEKTRAMFPYEFCLRVIFTLTEKEVVQTFEVETEGKDRMHFSLGAHPGFFCPIVLGEKAADYALTFDSDKEIVEYSYDPVTRLLLNEHRTFAAAGGEVPLSDGFFNNGPKVLGNVKARSVSLVSKSSGRYMKMGIEGFPFMCLWGLGGRMQIICIEPWCGTSDKNDTDFIWENKFGSESVLPGETFSRSLRFELG